MRGAKKKGNSSLRQRNELVFLRYRGKAAGFPILFGLLDTFLAGRDEIPPDMSWALQRVAAQKHHPCRLERLDGDAVTGPEDQELRTPVALIGNLDFAVHEIDRALLVGRIE